MKAITIVRRGFFSRLFLLASVPALLAGSFGCHAPPQPSGPTQMTLHVTDKDALIDETLTMLRELDFPPDRVDRAAGTIAAGPSTGGQWFEIWRDDVYGGYQILESSIHTIRRNLDVTIEPVSAGSDSDEQRVTVEVRKFRYAAPDRQITTASGALAIYSERLPTTEGLRKAYTAGRSWTPLGRDELLENALLSRIAEFSQGAAVEIAPEQPADSDDAG